MRCQLAVIGDGEVGSGGLFLGVFDAVDVFEDARVFHPRTLHGSMEMDNVGGLESTAAGGEVVKVGA